MSCLSFAGFDTEQEIIYLGFVFVFYVLVLVLVVVDCARSCCFSFCLILR